MAASTPGSPKKSRQIIILMILAGAVVTVLTVFICLLLSLWIPDSNVAITPTSVAEPAFELPTAPVPTATAGPARPGKIIYTAQPPIEGYSSCNTYGFKGAVVERNGKGIQNVQIVAWDKKEGLLDLDSTDAQGSYLIEIEDSSRKQRDLWVQLFQNDVPVSKPVAVQTQIDCKNGFQIYQINWQKVEK